MGRPPVVSDEEIIAAGRKLQAAGTVNATRIWEACGKRGRVERPFDVWTRWLDARLAESAPAPSGSATPIPEQALRLAAGLKAELLIGIDRALASIYQGIEEAVKGRYQAELTGLISVRESHACEMQDALAALGDMSEAQDERDARIADLEAAVVSTLRQRDVSEALRGVGAEQQTALVSRLQASEAQLEREREISVDLKIANVRAEEQVKALTQQLSEMQARSKGAVSASAFTRDRRSRGKARHDPGVPLGVHPDGAEPRAELHSAATSGVDGQPAPGASL